MSERKFVKYLLALTAISIFGVCVFNYAVNPRAEFRHELVPPVVQLSRRDKVRLYPEFVRVNSAPDIVIMGSSRSMEMRASDIGEMLSESGADMRVFHFGTNSAGIEDFLAELKYILDKGDAPKVILAAQDFRSFNPLRKTDKRFFAVPELSRYVPAQSLQSGARASLERFSALPTLPYLWNSALAVKWHIQKKSIPPVFGKNGDYIREKFAPVSDAEVAVEFSGMIKQGGDYYGFDRLGEKRKKLLMDFFDIAANENISVITWLTTVHPVLYESIMKNSELAGRRGELVTWEKELAGKYENVVFLDIMDPAVARCEGSQFRDPVHYSRECAREIARRLILPELNALNKAGEPGRR